MYDELIFKVIDKVGRVVILLAVVSCLGFAVWGIKILNKKEEPIAIVSLEVYFLEKIRNRFKPDFVSFRGKISVKVEADKNAIPEDAFCWYEGARSNVKEAYFKCQWFKGDFIYHSLIVEDLPEVPYYHQWVFKNLQLTAEPASYWEVIIYYLLACVIGTRFLLRYSR